MQFDMIGLKALGIREKIVNHFEVYKQHRILFGPAIAWMVYSEIQRKVSEETLQLQKHEMIRNMFFR